MLRRVLLRARQQPSSSGVGVCHTALSRAFRQRKGVRKIKEETTTKIAADDKVIKLSTKESSAEKIEIELKMKARREHRMSVIHTFDLCLEQKVYPEVLQSLEEKKRRRLFKLEDNPQELNQLYLESLDDHLETIKSEPSNAYKYEEYTPERFYPSEMPMKDNGKPLNIPENIEAFVNGRFYSNGEVQPLSEGKGRRAGLIGYKIGMTHVYDQWSTMIPLTVVHIDQCQVIQVKTREEDNADALVVGSGVIENFRMKKPQIGTYLKAGTPYKKHLKQFLVDKENFLPVGYMLGPRHFTVGQYIDIRGIARNKGVQGAVKKWGFKGAPATHGTSKTHRSLGSTGMSTNPGRVFKGKKMHGRMGGSIKRELNLQVYRVDHERSLLYICGPVPGAKGEKLYLQDAQFKMNIPYQNNLINFPTFIPQEGNFYANIVQMEAPELDPLEQFLHDEALPNFRTEADSDEDDSVTTTLEDQQQHLQFANLVTNLNGEFATAAANPEGA